MWNKKKNEINKDKSEKDRKLYKSNYKRNIYLRHQIDEIPSTYKAPACLVSQYEDLLLLFMCIGLCIFAF